MQGTVVKVFSDRIFILPDGSGCDMFAHRKQFADTSAVFEPGARVEFSTYQGARGLSANNVSQIEDDGKSWEHGAIEKKTNGEFAFIRADGGELIFVHRSDCVGIDWPPALSTRVTFALGIDRLGRPRAAVCRKEKS
jgi:cold shock CspA family protein